MQVVADSGILSIRVCDYLARFITTDDLLVGKEQLWPAGP